MPSVKTPRAITDMSTLNRIIFDPDTIPPSVPSNVVATPISSTRIDLGWAVSIDIGGSGLAGYLVFRNGTQVGTASSNSYSDVGLTANTTYQYRIAAVDGAGNVSAQSTIVNGTTAAVVGPPLFAPVQPAVAFIGIAGVRTYTDPAQQAAIGRYSLFVLGASWEGWATGGRDLDTGVVLPIKAASTAPGGTVLLNYVNLNVIEEDSLDPRPTWTAEVAARTWRLYLSGSSGTVAGSGTISLVNYTDFVPVNPSLEHPYEFGAKYSYNMLLTKSKNDARFSGLNPGLASSSLDGVYQDNWLCNPQANGDWNRDGVTEGQGWPCTATPWLQAGQARYCKVMRALAPTKYIFVNGGDYGLVTPGAMAQQADGILAESYMGKYWSWETKNGFLTMLGYYYQVLATAANPRMVVFGATWPDTNPDGSALVRLPAPVGFPPINTQWQWARYGAATAYLGEGLPAINRFSQGYSSDLTALDWYDFYGGITGLSRGWLGPPLDALRPTTPKIAKGPIGIFGVEYTNGIVLANPAGNGTQTVTNTDIPGSWKFLAGTQDPARDTGAAFSSISLPERDGLFLQRIASTPNTDYSWSAIVTGSAKSAAAGFIAPVIFNNGTTLSRANYQGGRIFPVTSACTVDMYFERVLGETGTISITINTFNSTNAAAGTNYTALTGATLSWADGEIGWKRVSIPILSIPTGFGLVGITLSGASAYRHTNWIWLQGTGLVPGAKFFQSSNGVNVNGNASGSGTAGSPWLGLSHAISTMGAVGGVLYWIQNGTNGHMEWGGTGGTSQGIVVNGFSASNSAPLIILPHPSNTSTAFMDQGCTAGGAGVLWSNAPALYFKGTGSGIWLCGIHFYRGGVQWNGQDVVQWSSPVMWQCEVDHYAVNGGSNVHCVRFEHVVDGIFQDCSVHHAYTNETFSANSYDALASGYESCFGTLRPSYCTIACCTMDHGQYALINKQGPDTSTDTPCEITHSLARQCQASTSSGGGLTAYPVQGTGFSNGLIRYCVYDGTNDLGPTGGSFITQFDDIAQAQNLDIFNSVAICGANGGGGFGELKGATGWRVFNNISQDSTVANREINVQSPGTGKTTQLLYCDKNMYVRGSHTWVAAGTSYASAAAWQAAGPNSVLAVTGNDANSVFTSTTPSYGNITVGNYRIVNSGGRGNRPIGVGNEFIGIVNNFLNPSLTVAI